MKTISPLSLHQRLTQGEKLTLIDVRSPAEFSACHVPWAISAPLHELNPPALAQKLHLAPSDEVFVICQSGTRARQAIGQMETAGFTGGVLVEGGTQAWQIAGLSVKTGASKVISLERQVRIGAGTLVLVGTLLGAFVHPAFLALAGFIGAGLVFAGITDRCGLAMVLARMPWNQAPSPSTELPASSCTVSPKS